MKVAIVTPTIGSEYLLDCISSVQNQNYENIEHYIFVDGEIYKNKVLDFIFKSEKHKKISYIISQNNIGKGWYGHRVYASCPFLVDADAICYLDEDNFFSENHISSLVEVLNEGNSWGYSFRNIVDKSGNFLCEDNCESLGKWPVFFKEDVTHIDTSSFLIRHNLAVSIAPAWYNKWGADRVVFNALKQIAPKYEPSYRYSLNYRLEGNSGSVTKDFFDEGNKVYLEKFNGKLPWKIK